MSSASTKLRRVSPKDWDDNVQKFEEAWEILRRMYSTLQQKFVKRPVKIDSGDNAFFEQETEHEILHMPTHPSVLSFVEQTNSDTCVSLGKRKHDDDDSIAGLGSPSSHDLDYFDISDIDFKGLMSEETYGQIQKTMFDGRPEMTEGMSVKDSMQQEFSDLDAFQARFSEYMQQMCNISMDKFKMKVVSKIWHACVILYGMQAQGLIQLIQSENGEENSVLGFAKIHISDPSSSQFLDALTKSLSESSEWSKGSVSSACLAFRRLLGNLGFLAGKKILKNIAGDGVEHDMFVGREGFYFDRKTLLSNVRHLVIHVAKREMEKTL